MKPSGKPEKETVASSAEYRGATILCTTYWNYIVIACGVPYPAGSLDEAKSMIDEMVATRRN